MTTEKTPLVNYVCFDCHKNFEAPQGSRRKYCPECLSKRVTQPTNQPKE